jgi:predicted alpha-1,6-mannanase (GH76 family)
MKLTTCALSCAAALASASSVSQYTYRATILADSFSQCLFQPIFGNPWPQEDLWQSGNTLEAMANLMILTNSSRYSALMHETFINTPVIVDNCFDDHQWWLKGWVRSYEATGNTSYLMRAAQVFDYVTANGWTTDLCSGGVLWCPDASHPYKNAITNELFLAGAIKLHPYASIIGKPQDYYLQWAVQEVEWFIASNMVGSDGLVNDGLDNLCQNNGQTTWTYNQGVFLDGLVLLSAATNNATYQALAETVATAAMTQLTTSSGVFVEPCGWNCDGDQHIFKGIFVRHLAYMLALPSVSQSFRAKAVAFIATNVDSMLTNDACNGSQGFGAYGISWQGPCNVTGASTTSAAIDLLLAAAQFAPTNPQQTLVPIGLGNCEDDRNQSMPNCYTRNVDEPTCASVTNSLSQAVAYDFMTNCDGSTFCRVRTNGPASTCPNGWQYAGGSATTVTGSNGSARTLCVVKST